jgi:hypothetical protein
MDNRPPNLLGEVSLWYIKLSVDAKGELAVIATLIGAVIIPQVLSFLISGLFGCGMPPILVSKVTKYAILILIKFLCVFSALVASELIYMMYFSYFHDPDISLIRGGYLNLYEKAAHCLVLLASSFSLSVLYSRSDDAFKYIEDRRVTKAWAKSVTKAWAKMTRFTHRGEEPDTDKLLERLEAHRDLMDIALLITSLGRLTYRNVVRAANSTDTFSEAMSVYRQLLKEGKAGIDRTAALIAALLGMKTTKEKK